MKVLRRETVPVEKLKVAPTNNRINIPTREELQLIINSVRATGIIDDIMVNEDYEIVSGQLRWIAAKEAGLKEVPVVVCKFRDKVEERAVSIIQDYIRHPLTDRDRGNFLKNAFKEGLSIPQISARTGIPIRTLYLWASIAKIPEIVEDKSRLERIEKLSQRKKVVAKTLLDKGQMPLDEVLEATEKLPTRELEEIRKQVVKKVPVDLKKRIELFEKKDELVLVRLRMSREWYDRAVKIARREGKDLHTLLLDIIVDGLKKLWIY